MAVIITNTGVPTGTFRLNGRLFNKVYQPSGSGTNDVTIYNTYDTKLQLLGPTNFAEFTVNGATYLTRDEVVEALLPIVYIDAGAGAQVEVWGDLTGTLSNQTDLQSALDAKQDAGVFADWANITNKPTTISGFGITDAYTKTESDGQYALLTDTRFLTTAQKTDLTDGLDSSAHFHSADRDRTNHTGTQAISTITGLQSALDAKVPTTRTISAGTGITGGGALSANRTISLDTVFTDGRYTRKGSTESITGSWTFTTSPTFSNTVSFPTIQLGNWTIEQGISNRLSFKYNASEVFWISTTGDVNASGNVTANPL